MVDGDQLSLVADGAVADPRHLRREISAAIDQQLWTQAAQHEQGKGLQQGVDLHATRLHLARQETWPAQRGKLPHGLSHRGFVAFATPARLPS